MSWRLKNSYTDEMNQPQEVLPLCHEGIWNDCSSLNIKFFEEDLDLHVVH